MSFDQAHAVTLKELARVQSERDAARLVASERRALANDALDALEDIADCPVCGHRIWPRLQEHSEHCEIGLAISALRNAVRE